MAELGVCLQGFVAFLKAAKEILNDIINHHLIPANSIADYFDVSGQCETLSQLNSGETCEDISGNYAETNTRNALDFLEVQQLASNSKLVSANFTDSQINQLESLLEALSDPCLEHCIWHSKVDP